MKKIAILSASENVYSDNSIRTEYYFYDQDKNPIHKSRVEFKKEKKIIMYPYSFNRNTGELKHKKIEEIEFIGWNSFAKLPKDFKKTLGYGFKSKRIKSVLSMIYPKFKELKKITFGIEQQNRFIKNHITFNWNNFEMLLKKVTKEFAIADSSRKTIVSNHLSNLSPKFSKLDKKLTAGALENYLSSFTDFEKISADDAESLAKIFEKIPSGKILTTNHFIKTKEKLDIVYLEDVIEKFKRLLTVSKDNEEEWQVFFEKYSWMLTHVFPYQVILKKGKAYVGGKTIENDEGRIVDFLFESNLSENLALLEIKTHKKELLKKIAYRKPDVFSYSDELSGGINQCLDQKDTLIKDFGHKISMYDPKCILVIGLKSNLTKNQKKCLELLRANQKNVDIVTFDELLAKLEGLHKVITGKFDKIRQ